MLIRPSSSPQYRRALPALGWALIAPVALLTAACGSSENAAPPQFAELAPPAMMQTQAAPPAPVEAAQTAPAPAPSGPAYGGHLASYYREADAIKGWNVIVRQQSSIGSLKRHIVPIKTPKGPMVRLIAGDFPSAEEATRFCTWARQQKLYCAVMELGANDATATPMPAAGPAKRARPARAKGGTAPAARPPG